jgi:integrase
LDYFKDYALSEISPLLVEKFKRDRLNTPVIGEKPRKPASVNRLHAILSGVLRMACDNGLIASNPCSKVKRLREDNARMRFLTIEEEEALLAGLKGRYLRMKPMVLIALNSGMRLGEIVNLTWNQIEWERNRLNVVNTKNALDRTIPMSQAVKDTLIQLWRNSDKINPRVFPYQKADAISLSFRLLVNFHFHDLRHTFAT